MLALIVVVAMNQGTSIDVTNSREFREAAARAKPGTTIRLASGDYEGGALISNLKGVTICGADPKRPPRFIGGGSGLQFSDIENVTIQDLSFEKARGNGLNIDDGGTIETPSRHVVIRNVTVKDLPKGNNDGIKLSGVVDFVVENCRVERWGGSAIDMVGCHRGEVNNCTFLDGGSSGVQMKGGTSEIKVVKCRFERYGERGVNLGGSTGLQYFRPPISELVKGSRFEARRLYVLGCTFIGGACPIAFVGCTVVAVSSNTIVDPERWAIRILQETRDPGFGPCSNGSFERNLVVFRANRWSSGGVNVGDKTDPSSFRFKSNFWYCMDRPERSRPTLPTPETEGVYGLDPLFINASAGDYGVKAGSPALKFGAHSSLVRKW